MPECKLPECDVVINFPRVYCSANHQKLHRQKIREEKMKANGTNRLHGSLYKRFYEVDLRMDEELKEDLRGVRE